MNLSTRAVLTAAASAAIAVAAFFGQTPLIIVVAVLGVIFAVGWSTLMGLPASGGSTLVVSLTTVGALATVAFTPSDPWLRYLPVVLAFGVLLAFINEMLRHIPRTRLIESLFGTTTGVIVAVCGAGWLGAFQNNHGLEVVVISASALAAASVAGAVRGPKWMIIALTLVLGTGTGLVAGHYLEPTTLLAGLYQGVLAGIIIAAIHALVDRMPELQNRRAGASLVVLPILALGILVYVSGRLVF